MRTIKQSWDEYLEDVVPSDACKIQIDCTREAFYAGALSMFMAMVRHGLTVENIRELQGELQRFSASVINERKHYDA